jgi:putative NADH-flavin reductase
MATILVIGASRGIGLETVKQALDAGHQVRALARSAEKIAIKHSALAKIAADAQDEHALTEALHGVDAVIQTLGVKAGPSMMLKPVDLFSNATRALLPAMRQAGVKRLIVVTGFGAGDSRDRGGLLHKIGFNLFLRRAYDDKDVQEKLIRESDLDWTIVRPVILYDGSHTGRYHVLTDPKRWRVGFISRADVADFLVKQIDDDRHVGATPVITG